jgi:hypothetical protein
MYIRVYTTVHDQPAARRGDLFARRDDHRAEPSRAEPSRPVPVYGEFDVVVVGGGGGSWT